MVGVVAAKRFALVKDGVVTNVIMLDQNNPRREHRYQPSGVLRELADDQRVEPGDLYDGTSFTSSRQPKSPPDIDAVKKGHIAAIDAEFQKLQSTMLVTPERREDLRVVAEMGAKGVQAAVDETEAQQVCDTTLKALRELHGSYTL